MKYITTKNARLGMNVSIKKNLNTDERNTGIIGELGEICGPSDITRRVRSIKVVFPNGNWVWETVWDDCISQYELLPAEVFSVLPGLSLSRK